MVNYSTTNLPVILGWTEQKYEYVPGFVGVKVNLSPVSSTFDLNGIVILQNSTAIAVNNRGVRGLFQVR
jgi:hypothetical protein